jgi:hypothetical protein
MSCEPLSWECSKDPDEVLDYQIEWADWLDGDTISTSTWTVPAGITKSNEAKSDTAAQVWLSGGTAGETYAVHNRITTAFGRTAERTISLAVGDR